MEAGLGTVTLASGDGTLAIEFEKIFDKIPVVMLAVNDDDYETTDKYESINAYTVTTVGFTIQFESASAEGTVDIAWQAVERRSSEKAGL